MADGPDPSMSCPRSGARDGTPPGGPCLPTSLRLGARRTVGLGAVVGTSARTLRCPAPAAGSRSGAGRSHRRTGVGGPCRSAGRGLQCRRTGALASRSCLGIEFGRGWLARDPRPRCPPLGRIAGSAARRCGRSGGRGVGRRRHRGSRTRVAMGGCLAPPPLGGRAARRPQHGGRPQPRPIDRIARRAGCGPSPTLRRDRW